MNSQKISYCSLPSNIGTSYEVWVYFYCKPNTLLFRSIENNIMSSGSQFHAHSFTLESLRSPAQYNGADTTKMSWYLNLSRSLHFLNTNFNKYFNKQFSLYRICRFCFAEDFTEYGVTQLYAGVLVSYKRLKSFVNHRTPWWSGTDPCPRFLYREGSKNIKRMYISYL